MDSKNNLSPKVLRPAVVIFLREVLRIGPLRD